MGSFFSGPIYLEVCRPLEPRWTSLSLGWESLFFDFIENSLCTFIMVFFSSMPIICRLGLHGVPSSPIISLYIKKFSHWALLSDLFPLPCLPPPTLFSKWSMLWWGFHRGSYLAYWVFIFQHCFSSAFLQQLYLLPEFNFYALDRCPYLIQLFAFFFFGLFERSYHCSFEFSVWEMVQIILIEVHYWLGLVNTFVENIVSCFLFCII